MLKKSALIIFGLAFCVSSFALTGGDDDKEKDGQEEKEKEIIAPSDSTLDIDVVDQKDDTLVFEDWERPQDRNDGGSTAISGRSNTSDNGDFAPDHGGLGAVAEHLRNLKDNRYLVNFEIYPNPAAHTLFIKASIVPDKIRIYSMSGVLVFEGENTDQVDVSFFEAGTYFIQLMYEDHLESRKFIKTS